MATVSAWTGYVEAATALESGGTSPSSWGPWVSASTAGETEWRVAGVSSWLAARMVTIAADGPA
jgi:hypothetical protein